MRAEIFKREREGITIVASDLGTDDVSLALLSQGHTVYRCARIQPLYDTKACRTQ